MSVGIEPHLVTDPEIVADDRGRRLPPLVGTMRRAWGFGRTRLGVLLLALVAVLALVGPYVAPHSPSEFVSTPFAKPSSEAVLGADYLGRDVLSRILWGGRSILWMAFAATTIGVFVGAALGMIAGYARNALDDWIMRSLDVLLAFPGIVLAILFVSMLGPKPWLIVVLVAAVWVPGVARVCRGVTLETVSREFIDVAEVLGTPRRRIIVREILPNVMTPLLVEYGLRLTWSIAAIAAISFLGFGIQPPAADWGLMINENRTGLTLQPWAVMVPIAAIAVLTIGTNLIAEGIARSIAGVDRTVQR
jgi:peptide/nickel transport system permease protein